MTDLEIKEFYRQMMVNITFLYLEGKYFLYCLAGEDAVLSLSVEECKNSVFYVRVEFNVVFLCCEYQEHSGNYLRLEGYVDISHHGQVFASFVEKEYLIDMREVYNHE